MIRYGDFEFVTLAERPALFEAADDLVAAVWPRFMLEDDVAYSRWMPMIRTFPEYQFFLLNGAQIVAYGNSIPLIWDSTLDGLPEKGWDGALLQGLDNHEKGLTPTTLCAISITITPDYQGKGISRHAILAMRSIAAQHNLDALVAPVRPNLKSRYPLTPMEQYVHWQHTDGAPFDPWLRTHARLGADLLKVEPESMLITGTVAEWEEWTALRLPESGLYVIPGALNPVEINREMDTGRYVEPNVWMRHRIAP
ncbi:MAG: GNAT family N-acetyltransferase [Anaerolineaceae bacterium]|nr:GNAT family N-acetyltransferase [Anaerolineaceae bacterium]